MMTARASCEPVIHVTAGCVCRDDRRRAPERTRGQASPNCFPCHTARGCSTRRAFNRRRACAIEEGRGAPWAVERRRPDRPTDSARPFPQVAEIVPIDKLNRHSHVVHHYTFSLELEQFLIYRKEAGTDRRASLFVEKTRNRKHPLLALWVRADLMMDPRIADSNSHRAAASEPRRRRAVVRQLQLEAVLRE